ncbi:RagB/SusD family nutrient uptake outer membrane protein [Pedobacter sp. P351]|uniref:RagB/SusD family nutrient uptake outer membrane protein n=1 Tax=Pedobacter superstes TaxID=3133441 RepID=UPI0030996A0F
MKKIFLILTIFLSTGITSCKKFLEEENPSGLTDATFYVDEAGFERLVSSCYSVLRDIYDGEPHLFEYGTDVSTRGEVETVSGVADNLPTRIQLNEYKELAATNSAVTNLFNDLYLGIQRCNIAINRADAIPMAESTKNKRLGEVRFLRAYYYYLLVENFGGTPIVQEEFTAPVTQFTPNTEQEVYSFIVSELNASLTELTGVTKANTQFGRVTPGAVKHLLSLIHLTRGYKTFGTSDDFTKSAQLAEEVIASNYVLLPSFADVFKMSNEKNDEIILSVQFDLTSLSTRNGAPVGHGQNILFGWLLVRELGFSQTDIATYNRRTSTVMPTQYLYSLYNTSKDARYDATFLSQFNATQDAGAIKKGDLRFYFPKPDQPFTAADELALKAVNPNVEVIRYDRWKQNIEGVGGAGKYPMINKFPDPTAPIPGSNEDLFKSSRDIILFRLAETYLIAAEAYFKLNQPDKAAEKLNRLRDRAEKTPGALDISSSDVNIDFILDEKAREFAGEYKRWLDLKRTRRLDRAFQYNILTNMLGGPFLEKYYLRPIPQTVIDRVSGVYPQNDDY